MIKSESYQAETLAKPLVELLREQYHPHCRIVIDNERINIVTTHTHHFICCCLPFQLTKQTNTTNENRGG